MFDSIESVDPLIIEMRRWRRLGRIKQAAAAELLGVSQATVSRWENGITAPDPEERRRLRALILRQTLRGDRFLRHVVERAPGLVAAVDRNSVVLAGSAAFGRVNRRSQAELVGFDFRPLVRGPLVEALKRIEDAGFYEGEVASVRVVLPVRNADGDEIFTDSLWTPYRLEDGTIARLIASEVLTCPAGPIIDIARIDTLMG